MRQAATIECNAQPPERLLPIDLLGEGEFFDQLGISIAQTGAEDRIGILTMDFEPTDPRVAKLVAEIHGAADRDVETVMGVDAYAFMVHPSLLQPGPLLLPGRLQGALYNTSRFRNRRQELASIAAHSSVNLAVVNEPDRPFTNPFAGRSHVKFAVVNDEVFISGANLARSERTDMALRFTDSAAADWLYELGLEINKTGSTREALGDEDISLSLDPRTELLIDAGKPDQSIIFDRAQRIIAGTRSWLVHACQYYPEEPVTGWLNQTADSGSGAAPVEMHAVYNRPSEFEPLPRAAQYVAMARTGRGLSKAIIRHPSARGQVLHTHALANEQSSIGGSFNNTARGVRYGTAELVVSRDDPAFAHEMGDFVLAQVGSYLKTPAADQSVR